MIKAVYNAIEVPGLWYAGAVAPWQRAVAGGRPLALARRPGLVKPLAVAG